MPTSIPLGPIQVNTSLFLQVYLGSQRCTCGGFFRNREQAQIQRERSTIRQVFAVCKKCRKPRTFEFDISTVGDSGEDRHLFMKTVSSFLAGLGAMKKHNYPTAETRFLETLNDETGEPNFTVAHYYLGRIAFESGRIHEAIQRFKRATLLQPQEISYHQALYEGYWASGNRSSALAEMAVIEDLKLRFDADPTTLPAFEE